MYLFLKKILEFIVNSNFWIAFATVCFYELSLLQNNIELQINTTAVFLFFSTLLVYNLYRILTPKEECKIWYAKNYSYTAILSIFSFFGTIISLYYLNKDLLCLIIISGVLSFFYASPFIKIGKKSFNLRKYWFLKSIIVALVWTLTTSVLPMQEFAIEHSKEILFSLEKFVFILGITIPYDIKDLKEDKAVGIKTMAMKLGVRRTKFISNSLLLLAMILSLVLYKQFLMSISIYSVAIFLNIKLDEEKDEFWYTFLIDGTIVLYFLLYYLFA